MRPQTREKLLCIMAIIGFAVVACQHQPAKPINPAYQALECPPNAVPAVDLNTGDVVCAEAK